MYVHRYRELGKPGGSTTKITEFRDFKNGCDDLQDNIHMIIKIKSYY